MHSVIINICAQSLLKRQMTHRAGYLLSVVGVCVSGIERQLESDKDERASADLRIRKSQVRQYNSNTQHIEEEVKGEDVDMSGGGEHCQFAKINLASVTKLCF